MENEERAKLVLKVIRSINSHRAVEGLESLSDEDLPLWKDILINAPSAIFVNRASVERYVKEKLKQRRT